MAGRPHVRNRDLWRPDCGPDLWRGTTTPPVEVPHRSSKSHRFANMRPSGATVIVRYPIKFDLPRFAYSHAILPVLSPVRQFRCGWMLKQQWKGGQRGRIVDNKENSIPAFSLSLLISSQINQRLSCDHLALGCGVPQWRTGAAVGTGD